MKKSLLILLLIGISFLGVNAKEISVDELKQTAVPEGQDGLVLDNETGRYFYQGENVNNFIKFNNELWRILSIEPDGKIKIVSPMMEISTTNSKFFYDPDEYIIWSKPVAYNTFLNSTFYNSLNNDKKYIVNGDFNIDKITSDLSNSSSGECLNNDGEYVDKNFMQEFDNYQTQTTIWNGKIAIPSLNEFLKTNNTNSWLIEDRYKNYITNSYYVPNVTKKCYIANKPYYVWAYVNYDFSISLLFGKSTNYVNNADIIKVSGNSNATAYLQSGLSLNGTGSANDPYELVLKAEEIKPVIKIVKDNRKVDNINLRKGDKFIYEVSQKVHKIGENIQNRYSFFSLTAKLPKEVEYIDAKIYDENENEILDGKIEYNKDTNEVTWTANESYLDESSASHMPMEGETYYFRINSKLTKDNISTISAEAYLNYKTIGSDDLVRIISNKVVVDTNKIKNPLTSDNMIIVLITSLITLLSIVIFSFIKKKKMI